MMVLRGYDGTERVIQSLPIRDGHSFEHIVRRSHIIRACEGVLGYGGTGGEKVCDRM